MRNWASNQIREITSAIQGTRQYSKEGKRYKSKSYGYIKSQISRLQSAVEAVQRFLKQEGDTFKVTTQQLNLAAANKPSVYSEKEVRVFYRTTQSIWNQPNVAPKDRNKAIVDYWNERRAANNLPPLTLYEIVETVLKAKEAALRWQELNPEEPMDEREIEDYANAMMGDTQDGELGSPQSGIGQELVDMTNDIMETLFKMPNPSSFLDDFE